MPPNILDLLKRRELSPNPLHISRQLGYWADDSFARAKVVSRQNLTTNSVSTIAIAMSPDRSTFASTHGDHTVKVFTVHNNKQIRTFSGHPRTPWTVRYHPRDPDIFASGCLGGRVRIWSIERDSCLKVLILQTSIISLSFHASGEYLAVAAGSKLEIWQWQQNDTRLYSTSTPSTSAPNPIEVYHARNIRAVVFHRGSSAAATGAAEGEEHGGYLLVAAPNGPRETADQIYNSLFCVSFPRLLRSAVELERELHAGSRMEDNQERLIRLDSFPVLVPQMHLYSDGGLDVGGEDDQYLLSCCRLLRVGAEDTVIASTPFSPMSTVEMPEEDRAAPPPPAFRLPPPAFPAAVPPAPPAASPHSKRPIVASSSQPGGSAAASSASSELTAKAPLLLRNVDSWDGTPFCRPVKAALASSGSAGKDCLCLLRLSFPPAGRQDDAVRVDIVNARVLSSVLVRAITSLKLSGSSPLALLGYGVRDGGEVTGHPSLTPAVEILCLRTHRMPSLKVITDLRDEVNVAFFHPLPGCGVVYGTKGGKTVVYAKGQESEEVRR